MALTTDHKTINESATLEWINEKDLHFRLTYTNRFYGSCTVSARLSRMGEQLTLDKESVYVEDQQVKHGEPSTLLRVTLDFFKQLLIKQTLLIPENQPVKKPTNQQNGARNSLFWGLLTSKS
jgi:hypothetical protein